MNLDQHFEEITSFQHLEILAKQIVEGFISGMHKSPFHGFSSEFAEHKVYNVGESTKHMDWKLFAKTDRLYTKRYEEETNLRCHLIIDNSSSMHYPKLLADAHFYQSKIGFSVLASAVLMQLLKKQRDAVGLSIYSDQQEFYATEKGSDRHHRMLLHQLERLISNPHQSKNTDTTTFLHQIAEKIHRRSMIILFTDMFQSGNETELFQALQHLKHQKHRVIVFHVVDAQAEINFEFDNTPRKFVDIESGEEMILYAHQVKEDYARGVKNYFKNIELTCAQNKIVYVPVHIGDDFKKIMTTYFVERQNFV